MTAKLRVVVLAIAGVAHATPIASPSHEMARLDISARIVNVEDVGGKTKITIWGPLHGVEDGMVGYILASKGGGYLRDSRFEVFDVVPTRCLAWVGVRIDDVERHPYVVLNPSNIPAPSGGAK